MSLPLLVVLLAIAYFAGMGSLEGDPRTFSEALEWTAETLTSTGYGKDNTWQHPVMTAFVIIVQFVGVFLFFLVFPLILIPFFEERFEGRLATILPDLTDSVLIYGWGPAVTSLADELKREKISFVVLEEDETVARRLRDRGVRVVFAQLEEDDVDLTTLKGARAVVANGDEANNAVLTLTARQQGFEGPIVALVENPNRRNAMVRAGATAAFTPPHVLAAAIAAKASAKINPRVAGAQPLGDALTVAELRIHKGSSLCGKTLAEADVRKKTGATIVGQWMGGELVAQPSPNTVIEEGTILVAAGGDEAIQKLSKIAKPITGGGHIVVLGYGELGTKVTEFLRMAGEEVTVLDPEVSEGVDVVGDVLALENLEKAGVVDAQAVVLTLDTDASTLFAAAVIRDQVPEAVIVASVNRSDNVGRLHRAGADFAMSMGQVAGALLMYNVLGQETMELQPQLKVLKRAVGERLEGQTLHGSRLRERTGCSVVAVARDGEVLTDVGIGFEFAQGDEIYVCGSPASVTRFQTAFADLSSTAAA